MNGRMDSKGLSVLVVLVISVIVLASAIGVYFALSPPSTKTTSPVSDVLFFADFSSFRDD